MSPEGTTAAVVEDLGGIALAVVRSSYRRLRGSGLTHADACARVRTFLVDVVDQVERRPDVAGVCSGHGLHDCLEALGTRVRDLEAALAEVRGREPCHDKYQGQQHEEGRDAP